MAMLTTEKKLN